MPLLCPRCHFFEINDLPWFPDYLRQKVQACLTVAWTLRLWPIQSSSPAHLVSKTLLTIVPNAASDFTFVDFCAGAGGPTPTIERAFNKQLEIAGDGSAASSAKFLLTDLHPHLQAWEEAAKKSDNLGFVAKPVDAANAPRDLLAGEGRGDKGGKKVFRLFFLAFHHFDDPLAREILRNSIETADGFGIFELQDRTISSFITICLMGLLLFFITPIFFWRSPGHLFFTYVIPIIPFVVVFDGYVSSIRTRQANEILALMPSGAKEDGWQFRDGTEQHTFPTGFMKWFIGVKKQ